jgi:hypothetical protein
MNDAIEYHDAVKFVKSAMNSKRLLNTFDTLKNMNKSVIRSAVERWAMHGRPLSQRTYSEVEAALDVRTATQLKIGVRSCAKYLAAVIGGRPYALVVEVGSEFLGRHSVKSSLWLATPLIRELAKLGMDPPSMVIPYPLKHGIFKTLVQDIVSKGIRDICHIDDALYSGQQKAGLVTDIERSLAPLGFTRQVVRVWIVAPFSTAEGRTRALQGSRKAYGLLRRTFRNPVSRVNVFAPFILKTPAFTRTALLELRRRGNKLNGKPMSIMPHKMPDGFSFYPHSLGTVLETVLPTRAIYRDFKLVG